MRRGRPRRRARRRSGITAAGHARLKELHRRVVMIRHGRAYEVEESDGRKWWWGFCARCNREGVLYCCHIIPVGRKPSMRYDSDNAFAACYDCHINWWHKHPLEADRWIRDRIGDAAVENLLLRSRLRTPVDYAIKRTALLLEERALLA